MTCGRTRTGLHNSSSIRDTGIDLVAKTRGTNEYHAIQCKFSAEGYPLELLQRVITVSLETMKIVRGLPHLDI